MLTTQEREQLLCELQALEDKARLIRMMLHDSVLIPENDTAQTVSLPPGISLRKDGRYVGRFMFRGKTYALYGKDPYLLKQRLDIYRLQICAGDTSKCSDLTLSQWFDIWITHYKHNHVKETTEQVYRSTYHTHVKPALGSLRLPDISVFVIQELINQLSEDISYSTLSRVYLILHLLYSSAIKNEITDRNPVKGVTLPARKKDKSEQRVLTLEEQEIFCKFATRAIEGGMAPQTLKTILGHSSLAMTMDVYSHVLPNTKALQMKKIESLL